MTKTEDYILQAQRVANRLFRDDLGFPIYVVKSQFPLGPTMAFAISGAASLYYSDLITERDGAGYLVVMRPELDTLVDISTVVIHEIAHFFGGSFRMPSDTRCSDWGERPKVFQQCVAKVTSCEQPVSAMEKSHPAAFWRANFHVWIRMHDAGFRCSSLDMACYEYRPILMRKALMPELEAYYDRPISEVLKTPAPSPFLQLFETST